MSRQNRGTARNMATTLKRVYIWAMGEERDLRASLERIGPQISGLSFRGELIDGKKKASMCAELGISFEIYEAQTLSEACSILWTRHPARALELAGPHSVLELSKLCAVSTTAIAKEQKANKPKRSHHSQRRLIPGQPYPQLKEDPKMIKRLFLLEPELYAYAKEAAAQRGHRNVSKLVRDALWKEIALCVPLAPQFQPRRVQAPNGARAQRRRSG
jgi:hypothetical protein